MWISIDAWALSHRICKALTFTFDQYKYDKYVSQTFSSALERKLLFDLGHFSVDLWAF